MSKLRTEIKYKNLRIHFLCQNQIHLKKLCDISAQCVTQGNAAIMDWSHGDLPVEEYNSDARIPYEFESENKVIAEGNNLTEEQNEEQIVQVSSHGQKIKIRKPLDYDDFIN